MLASYFRFDANKTFAQPLSTTVSRKVIVGYLFGCGFTGSIGADYISSKSIRPLAIAQVWPSSCAGSFESFH